MQPCRRDPALPSSCPSSLRFCSSRDAAPRPRPTHHCPTQRRCSRTPHKRRRSSRASISSSTVTGKIADLPIETLSGDLTNVPVVAAQGKASIIAFGQTFKDVDFVVADGDLYGALTPGSFTNFGPAADIYDVSKILNPDVGLANVLANFSDPKAEGRETINGVDTVKITGTVTADAVNGLVQIGATGPVPATAWIKEDGDHELIQAKLAPSEGNSVQMTLSDWGKSVTVTKPAA